VILRVRRPAHFITDVTVPDNCPANQAAAIIAWECGLAGPVLRYSHGGMPEAWKIGYRIVQHEGHEDVLYLHLDQTVADLPDPTQPVFLINRQQEVPWN
jgi:hypothetical protein